MVNESRLPKTRETVSLAAVFGVMGVLIAGGVVYVAGHEGGKSGSSGSTAGTGNNGHSASPNAGATGGSSKGNTAPAAPANTCRTIKLSAKGEPQVLKIVGVTKPEMLEINKDIKDKGSANWADVVPNLTRYRGTDKCAVALTKMEVRYAKNEPWKDESDTASFTSNVNAHFEDPWATQNNDALLPPDASVLGLDYNLGTVRHPVRVEAEVIMYGTQQPK